ncbi:MAG: glutamate--tRNA ligase [Patescibacteria group bacterium]|nr:glutamate--tRNA ligase [Patescibacteria group bacterium]MDE1943945.1 glutamate--tRNA ligase [Patescibacteria group bacterium]MDE1945022.1 glutamate--tRNA ligase [Patescibacteria group bacterium]MDE2057528.1 glutamate--tRNA ligase [Patescibacteria group bacterium]
MSTNVTVRIPPSPTGRLHIGTARTALFNYLFARHADGRIVFRSEDTDRTRSKREHEDEIVEGLHWLGLDWDDFSRQSEHAARHTELLDGLIRAEKAFVSKEPAKDDPSREVEVVRLKNPGRAITFTDEIRGEITFDTTELGDFVIARSRDDALYHFAVVADDWDAGVTHVIRGEDHISNTPRQILIQEALGAPRPVYAHIPLILDAKRAKLSKRSGATSVMDYRAEGFLPEALVNYFALLGWNPGSDREDFSLAELVEAFSLAGVQKSGAAFDREKLLSVNQRWMRKLSDEAYVSHLNDLDPELDLSNIGKIVPLLKERARTFGEAREMLGGELAFLFAPPSVSKEALLAKTPAGRGAEVQRALERALEALAGLGSEIAANSAKDALMPIAEELEAVGKGSRGAFLWSLRYALSGSERSPDPFTIIYILGADEALSRLRHALALLGAS